MDSAPIATAPLRFRYPRELAAQKVGGAVTLRLLIGASGAVEDAKLVRSSGHPALDAAAMEAVRGSSFHPARRDGAPVPVWIEQQLLGLCCRSSTAKP